MKINMPDDDKFQCWLIEMDFAIDSLQEIFSSEGLGCLDYSVESLGVLENWLQSKYQNLDSTRNSFGNKILDISACYVGETLRKNFGGGWILNTTDPKRVFYGIPELKGIRNQTGQICPLALVTTLISRGQKGFLRKIFAKHAGSGEE
jgi:hypothetical protein